MPKRQWRSARASRTNGFRLIRRHHRQIGERSESEWPSLAQRGAVTFRPGNGTSRFDELLRPFGTAVMIVLSYDQEGQDGPIRGYRARMLTDGGVQYGVNGNREFCHNGRLLPAFHPTGPALNVRNESLVDLLLRMDAACFQRRAEDGSLPAIPRLPRVMLGFAPQEPPAFEVSEGLKGAAARRLGISLRRLESNPPVLVQRLLEQTWESVLERPGSPGNPTGLLLVDAEFCTQAHRALRVFEDFRQLVGCYTWNPARAVEVYRTANPAAAILVSHGIDPASNFEQTIPHELIDRLEGLMRAEVGEHAVRFSQEDLLDGLTTPFEPLVACCEALGAARAKLQPFWSETTTDRDLRQALRAPKEGLRASGACRIQVLRTRPIPEPLHFTDVDLARRAEVDWRTDHSALAETPAEPSTQLQLCC